MLCAPINAQISSQLLVYLVDLQRSGAKKLTIAMSSPGGNVNAGITMYNQIRSMPYDIEMHNIGNIGSMANAVFLASRKRVASPSATFMFHGIAFDGSQNERLDERAVLEKLDVIQADHERTAQIISENSKLKSDEAMGLFKQQKTVDANWALMSGVVGEVREFTVPSGTDLKYII
jgi:ATP-dependent Clp protease protease subunit